MQKRYMAPEIALGKGTRLESDVYSFGILLCEIITLNKPFEEYGWNQPQELIIHAHKEGVRPSTTSIPSATICNLIEMCWRRDPNKRPTMAQVVNVLTDEVAHFFACSLARDNCKFPSSRQHKVPSFLHHWKTPYCRQWFSTQRFSNKNEESDSFFE